MTSVRRFYSSAAPLVAAVALLSGCGGSSAPLTPASALTQPGGQVTQLPQSASNAAHQVPLGHVRRLYSRSWMLPEAKHEPLLYVANWSYFQNDVLVFSYPAAKLVGTLTADMLNPDGLCVNKKGDVWVVNNTPNAADLVEFAHGGTTPIATLGDPAQIAETCSVDFVTGDLAVANHATLSSGAGSVSVYAHAQGSTPQIYGSPQIAIVYFCGYDDKGNLFIDGTHAGYYGFEFAELAKGKKSLQIVKLKGGKINFPGQIQWDGKHLAVGDQEFAQIGSTYDSAIYQTTGASGKIVGLTKLTGSQDVAGFWIDGDTVAGPNSLYGQGSSGGFVGFYKYPGGGKPTKQINKVFNDPLGAAISP
ncbi:MAG: hypothetical protein WA814_06695 [Candidatus Baltobacteraceae bacterium]